MKRKKNKNNINNYSIDEEVNDIIEKSIEDLVIGCEMNQNECKSQSSILTFRFI